MANIDFIENLFGEDPESFESWDGEGGGIDFPDPGDYEIEVKDVVADTSKGGNAVLVLTNEVVKNADGSDTDQAGKTFKKWLYVEQGGNETALKRTKHFLLAAGVDLVRFSPSDLVGSRLIVTIVASEYEKMDSMSGEMKTFSSIEVRKERPVEKKAAPKTAAKTAAKAVPTPAKNGKPAAQARR